MTEATIWRLWIEAPPIYYKGAPGERLTADFFDRRDAQAAAELIQELYRGQGLRSGIERREGK